MSAVSMLQRLFQNKAAADGALHRPSNERWGRICPHCKGPSRIRSSCQVTPVYREQLNQCENPLCGHVWIDGIGAVRTLSPSAVPDAGVRIPMSPHVRREQVVASMRPEDQLEMFGD